MCLRKWSSSTWASPMQARSFPATARTRLWEFFSRTAQGARQSCCVTETVCYTRGMKTAISLPDAVFHAAERHARRSHKSRSQLYAEAVSEYLSRHAPDEVTDAMNRVVDQLDERHDPFVLAAARSVL